MTIGVWKERTKNILWAIWIYCLLLAARAFLSLSDSAGVLSGIMNGGSPERMIESVMSAVLPGAEDIIVEVLLLGSFIWMTSAIKGFARAQDDMQTRFSLERVSSALWLNFSASVVALIPYIGWLVSLIMYIVSYSQMVSAFRGLMVSPVFDVYARSAAGTLKSYSVWSVWGLFIGVCNVPAWIQFIRGWSKMHGGAPAGVVEEPECKAAVEPDTAGSLAESPAGSLAESPAGSLAESPAESFGPTPTSRGNRKKWLVAGGLVAVVAVAAGLLMMLSGEKGEPMPESRFVRCTANNVNLRQMPNTQSAKLYNVPSDFEPPCFMQTPESYNTPYQLMDKDILRVLGEEGDWYKLSVVGIEAYAMKKFFAVVSPSDHEWEYAQLPSGKCKGYYVYYEENEMDGATTFYFGKKHGKGILFTKISHLWWSDSLVKADYSTGGLALEYVGVPQVLRNGRKCIDWSRVPDSFVDYIVSKSNPCQVEVYYFAETNSTQWLPIY